MRVSKLVFQDSSFDNPDLVFKFSGTVEPVTMLAGHLLYNSQGSRSQNSLSCKFQPVLAGHLSRTVTATFCGPPRGWPLLTGSTVLLYYVSRSNRCHCCVPYWPCEDEAAEPARVSGWRDHVQEQPWLLQEGGQRRGRPRPLQRFVCLCVCELCMCVHVFVCHV